MDYNFENIVREITDLLHEADSRLLKNSIFFRYVTDGYVDIIEYGGISIFNSETDLSEIYKESEDNYFTEEEFKDYILDKTEMIVMIILDSLEMIKQNKGEMNLEGKWVCGICFIF